MACQSTSSFNGVNAGQRFQEFAVFLLWDMNRQVDQEVEHSSAVNDNVYGSAHCRPIICETAQALMTETHDANVMHEHEYESRLDGTFNYYEMIFPYEYEYEVAI
eukprot:scaffold63772_cov44-Prasinocladus_malaysianus.AAC.1